MLTAGNPTTAADARRHWVRVAAGALVVAVGVGAAHYMDVNGHVVTGMDNQVVWGLPHVFAILLIVAASGVLNVASVGSVFGQPMYKARAPLSGLLAIALLAGGLMVLMLDLGRPERVIVAATHYNFTSVFAWNVFLYSGMFALVAVYLWTSLERRFHGWARPVGLAVLVWRFALTTGTGSIFGFLVARQAYQSALLAPLFIVMSFGWGLAVFVIAQTALAARDGSPTQPDVVHRLSRLLGVFVAAALYAVAVVHVTHGYFERQQAFEAFVLRDGAPFPLLFWGGYVVLGSLLPMGLLFHPRTRSVAGLTAASALVLMGAFAWLYVFIIGGQAFPLEIFPGHEVRSTFADGQVSRYVPSLPEVLLGFGGIGAAFLLTVVGVRVLNVAPGDGGRAGH